MNTKVKMNHLRHSKEKKYVQVKEEPLEMDCEEKNGENVKDSSEDNDDSDDDVQVKEEPLEVDCEERNGDDAEVASEKNDHGGKGDSLRSSSMNNSNKGKDSNKKSDSNLVLAQGTGEKFEHYKCGVCTMTFIHYLDLVEHVETHDVDKIYQCNHCEAQFEKNNVLLRHMVRHIGTGIKHLCTKCNKEFEGKSFHRHLRSHEKTNDVDCEQRDKSFKLKEDLVKHLRDKDEELFTCNDCNKSFTRRSSLTRHQKVHSKERPFSCEDCDKSFKLKEHLVKHMKSHYNKTLYKCEECDKKFTRNYGLTRHMKLH